MNGAIFCDMISLCSEVSRSVNFVTQLQILRFPGLYDSITPVENFDNTLLKYEV